jgi:hypothetical protein
MAQQDKKAKIKSMKLTPERTMEVADSLMFTAKRKKESAYTQRRIGNATVENKVADKQVTVDRYGSTLSGNDRLKIAERQFKESTQDSSNAERYKSLALKAMNKNK